MPILDDPVEMIGSAIGGVFGWTASFIFAVLFGLLIGASVALNGAVAFEFALFGMVLIAFSAVIGHTGHILFLAYLFVAWILPLHTESMPKRIAVLLLTGLISAVVGYDGCRSL